MFELLQDVQITDVFVGLLETFLAIVLLAALFVACREGVRLLTSRWRHR